jgi:hypothetical protein
MTVVPPRAIGEPIQLAERGAPILYFEGLWVEHA